MPTKTRKQPKESDFPNFQKNGHAEMPPLVDAPSEHDDHLPEAQMDGLPEPSPEDAAADQEIADDIAAGVAVDDDDDDEDNDEDYDVEDATKIIEVDGKPALFAIDKPDGEGPLTEPQGKSLRRERYKLRMAINALIDDKADIMAALKLHKTRLEQIEERLDGDWIENEEPGQLPLARQQPPPIQDKTVICDKCNVATGTVAVGDGKMQCVPCFQAIPKPDESAEQQPQASDDVAKEEAPQPGEREKLFAIFEALVTALHDDGKSDPADEADIARMDAAFGTEQLSKIAETLRNIASRNEYIIGLSEPYVTKASADFPKLVSV